MAERKRRGLGRGLGALINSDGQDSEARESAAAQEEERRPSASAEHEEAAPGSFVDPDSTTLNVSRGTKERGTGSRPIDVFFSAKSDLDEQLMSRETAGGHRPTTTSRRASNGQRAPMPDVLSRASAKSAVSASESSAVDAKRLDESDSRPDESSQSAWTNSVSRETGGSVGGAEFRSIPVGAIVPNPRQPRQEFDEEHMDELVHSIREIGMLQPVVVRPAGPEQYELVMGERRWRASKAAGLDSVPAIVRMTKDDDLLRDALLENIHRSQLNPLEEAAAYRQLLDDFNCTQDELAERIGRSRPQISNTLRLMKLPPAVQRRVAAGVLSSGHARALLGLKSPEQMEQLAGRIVAEGLSVRATEEAVTLAQRNQGTEDLGRGKTQSPRVRQLDEFSDALTDRLDTQVKITLGAKKGRIAIDFGSIDDLHRLMDMIGTRH